MSSTLPPGFELDPPVSAALPPGFTLDQVPAAALAEPPKTRITVTKGEAPPAQNPPPAPSAMRSLQLGAQGVGSGLADTVGMPVDAMTGLINAGIHGFNWLTGYNAPPIEHPFLGSESIRDAASKAASAVGIPVLNPADMTPNERLGYNIDRFGTQALSSAIPLAAVAAPARAAAIAGGKATPQLGDAFLRPYMTDGVARTVAGDAAAGAGTGVATNVVDEHLHKAPDSPWWNSGVDLARGLAPLIGGATGSHIASTAEDLARAVPRAISNRQAASGVFLDRNNPGAPPVTNKTAEAAARRFQGATSAPPSVVAQNIGDASAYYKGAGLPQPSVGLISGDTGLNAAETAARTKNGVPFIENDNKLRQAANDRIGSLLDKGADQGAPAAVARVESLLQLGKTKADALSGLQDAEVAAAVNAESARKATQAAEENARAVEAERQRVAALAGQGNSDAKATASRRLDTALVDRGYIPARTEKNRQFDTAPGRNQPVNADPVLAAADDVLKRNNALRPDEQLPTGFITRLQALRPENGGAATARGGDLADTRKYLSTAYEQAQRSGNFDLADSIQRLRGAINDTITAAPGYAEANANYRQFADRYRPSPNDPGAQFTRQIDRDPGRGLTPPSETAGRFLAGPEKAQALQRMLENSPDGINAVRDYLRSDFAKYAVNRANDTLNPAKAATWARDNADVLAQFPQIRAEFDDMVATARRGDQLSAEAKTRLAEARNAQAATEQAGARDVHAAERAGDAAMADKQREIDKSALGTLLNEDPRDTMKRIFSSGKYASEKELDNILKVIGADKVAKRGLKAALSEHLSDSVSGVAKVDAGRPGATPEGRVELARLNKMFDNNRALLAKVYSPDEMNTLQQAHAALAPLANASARGATGGSNTADKMSNLMRYTELGVKTIKGTLRGGSIMRNIRLAVAMMPNQNEAVDRLLTRAWFDPDIAKRLLTLKTEDLSAPTANAKLRWLQGVAAYGRSSSESPEGEQK